MAQFIRLIIFACAFYLTLASSGKYTRSKPSRGALVVDASGKYTGSYATIQAAITALHNKTDAQKIFVFPGKYAEQVYIPAHAGPLTIQGYTNDARGYTDNEVTITGNLSRQTPGLANNDATSTVRVWTSNVKFYNLNIENTFGPAATNGQALALSAQNTNQAFYGCNFSGYQDTVYANQGRQIYAHSRISGAIDFIFGLHATAWFDRVHIETTAPGFITANGRDAANNSGFYVVNRSKVSGSSGRGSTFLGRPWRQYSRVVFQNTELGDVVDSAGWARWDAVQPVNNIVYGEYGNFGPGSAAQGRANFSTQLSAPVQAVELFGKKFRKEWWVDEDYLS